MKLKNLYGDELDKAVAIGLGWTLVRAKNPKNDYFQSEDRPIFAANWQPSQSARQAMRLLIEQQISIEYLEDSQKWRAYSKNKNGEIIESIYKRPHEAVCRAFVLKKESEGIKFDIDSFKD